MGELLYVALILALLGLLQIVLFRVRRHLRGFSRGETLALDDLVLFSERLKLVGRPDRIVRQGDTLIPEEWKSSKRVNEGHKLQLSTYFLLINILFID
jgi:CRISPR-associated exonuclease Cas4